MKCKRVAALATCAVKRGFLLLLLPILGACEAIATALGGAMYVAGAGLILAGSAAIHSIDSANTRRFPHRWSYEAPAQVDVPGVAPPAAAPMPAAIPPVATPAAKPPKCSEVGGYEAYKKRTGELCEL